MPALPLISLVLADPHPLTLRGMQDLFAQEHDLDVRACCDTAAATRDAVRLHQPDVLVMDSLLTERDQLPLLRELREESPALRIVVFTATVDERDALTMIQLGVRGMILKDMAPAQLLRCIRKVHAGSRWVEMRSYDGLLEKALQRESAAQELARVLTSREIDVMRLIAAGLANAEIARRLVVAEGTVKTHLHSVYRKLKVDGRAGLMLYAQRHGLA
jgi:DNA-binding NarL/FixJ family response regulator